MCKKMDSFGIIRACSQNILVGQIILYTTGHPFGRGKDRDSYGGVVHPRLRMRTVKTTTVQVGATQF